MNGILTHRQIRDLVERGQVRSRTPFEPVQFQPTTLDLRLGPLALGIRAGFLPARGPVDEQVRPLVLEQLDLSAPEGAVLRRGRVYLVRLLEELALPAGLRARCNPRSSTGRIDVFTRAIVDRHERFDDLPEGYAGPLWLEIAPRSFDVRVRVGQRLNQMRFLSGQALLSDERLRARVRDDDLLPGAPPPLVHEASLLLGLSLQTDPPGAPIGRRARRAAPVLDLAGEGAHEPLDFFEPVTAEPDGTLLLQPEDFYILASAERMRIPPDLAAEMLPYDVGMGELRTNYAGFFDPGFGWGPDSPHGARAVLEVRPHDVPFRVEHGQPIFRLQFSTTVEASAQLYGGRGSAYQNQGLALARYFRAPTGATCPAAVTPPPAC